MKYKQFKILTNERHLVSFTVQSNKDLLTGLEDFNSLSIGMTNKQINNTNNCNFFAGIDQSGSDHLSNFNAGEYIRFV